MKIRIVCYEDPNSWICGKIARRLAENVVALGHDCTIAWTEDRTADINHHVIYLSYPGSNVGVHTLMVTHIDDALKLRKLQACLETAAGGICASAAAVDHLVSVGINRRKLAYVNLAHDGNAKPRRFTVGITTRLYPDGRKRESDLVRLSREISPDDFAFKIMGFGWASIVADLRERGFEVEYHEDFDYEKYLTLIGSLDYFLYLSEDEGSMGFIDALAAGVKTIVQPQGFHLDAPDGITHPFSSFLELKAVFVTIAGEKWKRQEAVAKWTWEQYARAHLSLWERCLQNKPISDTTCGAEPPPTVSFGRRVRLWSNAFANRARTLLNVRKDFHCDSRLWQKRHGQNRGRK
jgi:hypothetical protein